MMPHAFWADSNFGKPVVVKSHGNYKLVSIVNRENQGDSKGESCWSEGSESAMFNKLEEIAETDEPKTPVLDARMSKALDPKKVRSDVSTK